jgi:hypothetical protein
MANSKQISSKSINSNIIGALVAIFLIIIYCLFSFFLGRNYINADHSSELILGKLLAETNSLISKNFIYSTELRIFNSNLVYTLGWKLFNSYPAVRTFGQAISLFFFYAMQFYFYKKLNFKHYGWWALLLLLPITGTYYKLVLFGITYAINLTVSFLILFLFISYSNSSNHKLVYFIIGVLLSFLGGIQGTRRLLISLLPLFLSAIFLFIFRSANHQPESQNEDFKSQAFFSFSMIASSGFGFLINTLILQKLYSFKNWSSIQFQLFDVNRAEEVINGYLSLFGISNVNVVSLAGISTLSGFTLIACCVLFFFFRKSMIETTHEKTTFLLVHAVFVNLVTIVGLLFTTFPFGSHYFLLVGVMFIPYFIALVESRWSTSVRIIKNAFLWLVVICLFTSSVITGYKVLQLNSNKSLTEVSNYLVENGYNFGYAKFWSADTLTEISDGKLEVLPLLESDSLAEKVYLNLEPSYWLVRKDTLVKTVTTKTFIIVSMLDFEKYKFGIPFFADDFRIVYSNQDYLAFSFDNSSDLYTELQLKR